MRVLMGYPGGKSLSRPEILPILQHPAFRTLEYREPFAGGLSIGLSLFEKSPRRGGWVNDSDPTISAVLTAVKLVPDQFQAGVRRFWPTVEEFENTKQSFLANPPWPKEMHEVVNMAVRKLAIHKMSFSCMGECAGVYGGQAQVGETVDARWNPKALCARIERIHPILRRVHVSNLDFISVIRDESRRAPVP